MHFTWLCQWNSFSVKFVEFFYLFIYYLFWELTHLILFNISRQQNYYDLLKVDKKAEQAEIKAAYIELSKSVSI